MSKYTKSPWRAEENRVFQVECPTLRIAICTSNIADYPEEQANATLISAAPELLEACKQANTKECVMPDNWRSKDLIKTLQQAIAKAEGK